MKVKKRTKRKVFIINSDKATDNMFKSVGYEITTPAKADFFQFTGSGNSDVPSELYNEPKHPNTFPDYGRAKGEQIWYSIAKREGIPMAGICYGGQFLNVMNGGWLWQDINGHHKPHYITDYLTGETYIASSSHHQAMRKARHGEILAVAGETTFREWCTKDGHQRFHAVNPAQETDLEVVFYPDTKSLCVQYHPEYEGFSALAARYFDMIDERLFNGN